MNSRSAALLILLTTTLVASGVVLARRGALRAGEVEPGRGGVVPAVTEVSGSGLLAANEVPVVEPAEVEPVTPSPEPETAPVAPAPTAVSQVSRPHGLTPQDFMTDPRDSRPEPVDAEKVFELVQRGDVDLASLTEAERAAYEVGRQKREGRDRPSRVPRQDR